MFERIDNIDRRIDTFFEWLNSEASDTKAKVAQNVVVFGLLGLCIIGAGLAS